MAHATDVGNGQEFLTVEIAYALSLAGRAPNISMRPVHTRLVFKTEPCREGENSRSSITMGLVATNSDGDIAT